MNPLWPMDPPVPQSKMTCIPLHKTLADEPTLANGNPQYLSRDDFHTTTQNLADEPTLAEHNGKGLKAHSFQGCWSQWQSFESSHIHHFWDTPQHFLKTHFCLESGFLLFLELQKSLLVTFQGCWTQWQRFESSQHSLFLRYPTAFSQNTCFSLESGFLLFLELQKSLLVTFQGCWITMAKVW